MTKEYVQMVGRMAYVGGWHLVNSHNRRTAFSLAPMPGLNGGVLPAEKVGQNATLSDYVKPEQTFVTYPNRDVLSGAGDFALDKVPVVFQVADFKRSLKKLNRRAVATTFHFPRAFTPRRSA
jgi:hypothetical protein